MNTEWLVGNPSRINVFAALWVGSVGLLVLGLQPILLGALLTSGRVNFDQLALAATVEILAIGIGSVLSAFLLGSGAVRLKAAIFLVLTAIFNHATAATDGPTTIIVTRGLVRALPKAGSWPSRWNSSRVRAIRDASGAISSRCKPWLRRPSRSFWRSGSSRIGERLAGSSAGACLGCESVFIALLPAGYGALPKTGRPGGVWSLASGGADGVAGDLRLLHVPRLDLGVSGAAGRRRRHCSRGHRADGIRQPRGPDFGRGDFHSGRGPPAISSVLVVAGLLALAIALAISLHPRPSSSGCWQWPSVSSGSSSFHSRSGWPLMRMRRAARRSSFLRHSFLGPPWAPQAPLHYRRGIVCGCRLFRCRQCRGLCRFRHCECPGAAGPLKRRSGGKHYMTRATATTWSNWAGNVRASPRRIVRPADEGELGEVIRTAPGPCA